MNYHRYRIKKTKQESKVEEKKNELPPLPNIKNKQESKVEEKKNELPPLLNIKNKTGI